MKLHHRLIKSVFTLASRSDPPPPPFDKGKVRSVLLISTTAIGDTLLSTPAIRAVREGLPGARVVVLASRAAREVLKGSPRVDEILDHPGKLNLRYLAKAPALVQSLRRRGFDLVVVLHANDPDAGPLAYMTGAPWRMGWQESKFSFLFTHPVKTRYADKHELTTRLHNLEALGIPPRGKEMEIFLDGRDRAESASVLESVVAGVGPFVAVHPFGSKSNKWWPRQSTAEFARLLIASGYTPVIVGGSKEADEAGRIAKVSGAKSTAGRLSIRGTAALLSECALVVSTDSGPMHLAQAVGTPTVALFGPDDPALTGPLNSSDVVIRKDLECVPCLEKECARPEVECMRGITPAEVMEAAREMLSAERKTTRLVRPSGQ